MKNINVPAQVTTVEDRVVGNLTFTQIGLLATPIFINFGLYTVLPKSLHLNLYKLVPMFFIAVISSILAIRVQNKTILDWTIMLARFRYRPKFYVFSKKSLYLRSLEKVNIHEPVSTEAPMSSTSKSKPTLNVSASNSVLKSLNLNFIEERKGRLYVYVKQND